MAALSKKYQKRKSVEASKVNRASKEKFKTKRESRPPARSKAVALQLEDDVPDFPRGNGNARSRRESNVIMPNAEVGTETEEPYSKKNKRKKQHQRINAEMDDLGSLFGGGISGKLPRYANKITFKNISPGMKLWGVVAEVNEKDIVVSLPGGLRGLVRASEVLDPILDFKVEDADGGFLASIFYPGQLVSCTVLRLDEDKKERGKPKVWLSLHLSLLHKGLNVDAIQEGMALTACVKSIEDHGYILHFGLPSFTGFLSQKSHVSNSLATCKTDVKIGQLIQVVVQSVDEGRRVVYLSLDKEIMSKCVTRDIKGISIDLLVPGMLVNARVQAVLENGILLSFLTYFTGTVDIFHLQNPFPNKNWKDDYGLNKKVNARILFIDPSSRAIGLTLNPHLVENNAPPLPVKTGAIYEEAKIMRVDKRAGLLLGIPTDLVSTPAYVNVSDVTEDATEKLEKKFKEGSSVRVRILGLRHLEGIAVGVLKASAFEGPVFTHADVKPGMVVKAKVVAVESFGAIVQFSGGIKALCPLRHMSEFEVLKPGKKFMVGAELVFRVLGCKSKRITVTHKKTLVKSKLPVLSSYMDAIDGLVTHGCITKVEKHGCFIQFYNGVKGFAPRHELGIEAGSDPESMYHVGQVVKCRVVSSIAAVRRINLSFNIKPKRVPEGDEVKLGSIVSGTVDHITSNSVIISISRKGYMKGTIPMEHLADYHEHAVLMKSALKLGYLFEMLLVIDLDSSGLLLSAKHSLLSNAQELPSDICQIHPNLVVNGYICNLIDTGCFVRFLGRLTGFSPRSKASDGLRGDLFNTFYVGQSVRSAVVDVDTEANRVTLSLKQSCCFSTDASLINGYFLSDEKITRLQMSSDSQSELKWREEFSIGSIVEGTIQEAKDLGFVVSFEQYERILGFIPKNQLGDADLKLGSTICAAVLDVSGVEGLIDLTLKPEFMNKPRKELSIGQKQKKRGRDVYEELELHQRVNAVVEIVKDQHLVLSIPDCGHAIGFALVFDYNTQKLPRKQYLEGQSVVASVVALPAPSSLGRLLLLLESVTEMNKPSQFKKAKKKSDCRIGSVVQAEITKIKPLELGLKFGVGFRGRIHITEVADSNALEEPFREFRIGQTVTARVVEKPQKSDTRRGNPWELSMRPSILTGSSATADLLSSKDVDFSIGQYIRGYVYKVDNEWTWLTISQNSKAQLFILDSSCEPGELEEFHKRFSVGKAVSGYVLSVNKEKKLRIILHPIDSISRNIHSDDEKLNKLDSKFQSEDVVSYIRGGDVIGGRISKIFPGVGGLLVQIGPHAYGRVHFTEIQDSWVPDPLSEYSEGQFVKCKVLEVNRSEKGTVHVDLSLRLSLKGMSDEVSTRVCGSGDNFNKRIERIEDLCPDMVVQGYVKSIMSKGCFIVLSRKLEAKILLSNLSDGFIEDPQKEFPIGRLVSGRVLSVEPLSKRIEVTLKSENSGGAAESQINDFCRFHMGDMVYGKIKRVESFGLFITIDNSNVVGLCHISEISDDRIDNIGVKYSVGQKVKAKILKVDRERLRISLGMKNSYIQDGCDDETGDKGEPAETDTEHINNSIGTESNMNSLINEMAIENGKGAAHVLSWAESRAFVPPLEVNLDDIEQSDYDNTCTETQERVYGKDPVDVKNKRQERKKAKEEREREIRTAEERLLKDDVPKTADDFEKLVRSSPNSSFVWIKYMAFTLCLADYEKARAIAERALRTINIREEDEKLNIWVAYLNLENEHGHPPEEAVSKVFQRALQSCDSKKIHLALLGMYERTEQNSLADELLEKMIKKFKRSCKVWLRRVQRLFKQNQDGVQSVVNRAIICLPKHKHIKFISQTAILEFKCGVPNRGRSMFEGILREYPKRTDLWSVYLDQEIRLGEVDVIRSLFERAISLSLSPKKMKFLFKKYLEYEKSLGDDERMEYVKQKALEYVANTMA